MCLLADEPSADRVEAVLERQRPVMSWVNLGEVYYIVRGRDGDAEARQTVRDLRPRLRLETPSEERVLAAAAIKADHPMAYPDAFAAATAVAASATLMTGDPELLVPDAPWRWEDLRP